MKNTSLKIGKIEKLSDVANVQLGYQHRGPKDEANRVSLGSHRLVQIKDLDFEEQFKESVVKQGRLTPYLWSDSLYKITPPGNSSRYEISRGDIIFLSRGPRACAIVIEEELEATIASYYFYIIRTKTKGLMPEYVAWYINQPPAQKFITSHQRGSGAIMMPKSAFEEMPLPIPSLEKQKAIIELERLRQREEQLSLELIETRKRYLSGVSLSMTNNFLLINKEKA